MKSERSRIPPAYPAPVTNDRQRQAVKEARELQGRPLTRARFNLYSNVGRCYLAFMLSLPIILGAVIVSKADKFGWSWNRDGIITLATGCIGYVSMVLFMIIMYRKQRRIHRLWHDQCLRCGYDLRATPDRCPECGTIVSKPG